MISKMDAKELKQKLDNNEKIILIDCREKIEWDESRIETAQFLPLSDFEKQMEKLEETDKGALIVCQCRSGKRSMSAAAMLQDEGFKNLYNLEGGILGWIDEGFPLLTE